MVCGVDYQQGAGNLVSPTLNEAVLEHVQDREIDPRRVVLPRTFAHNSASAGVARQVESEPTWFIHLLLMLGFKSPVSVHSIEELKLIS